MNYLNNLVILLLSAAVSFTALAQREYRIDGDPLLKVSGTSTLHDWDMVSEQATGIATLTITNKAVTEIHSAKFFMPAKSLKSGKRQMDTNAYKALQTDKNKEISFVMNEAREKDNTWLISGMLDLAGMKKAVTFRSEARIMGESVQLTGKTSFKLTAFGIEPPTALLGTIKTGDDVDLFVQITLKPTI
jgi:polyisoprenoid-binding protein YceI